MATDIELFVAIAEIAGVFVGFGALISVTRQSEIQATQLTQVRAVVTIGLVVLVAALIPVGLERYGLTGRSLWFTSSLLFLLLSWVVIVLSLRKPENRQMVTAQARSSPLLAAFFWLLLELPVQVPLLLAVSGVRPALDPAFYLTALLFNLFEAAFVLAQFVYSQVHP
jgi:O-antigen/teichoic acid export membrane protein